MYCSSKCYMGMMYYKFLDSLTIVKDFVYTFMRDCCCLVSKACPTLLWPHQASLSMELPRQENWNSLPFPSPGDLLGPGIKPVSPALTGRFVTTEPPGKPFVKDIGMSFSFLITYLHMCQVLMPEISKEKFSFCFLRLFV